MKKVLKVLLLVVVFLFSVNSVSALSTDKTIVYTKTRDHYVQVQNLYTGDYIFKTSMYELSGNGETYMAYCMDPHKAASDKYTLDRILGDSSNSVGVQAFDMGILNILKHAYTQINSSYSLQSTVTPESTPNKYNATVTGDNLYASSSIAIRAFILGLYGWGGAGIDKNYYMKSQASAHVNLGINWASWYGDAPQTIMGVTCSGQADCQQRYLNLRKSSYSWFLPSVQMHGWTYGTSSYDVIYAAQELFYHGIDAAMEVYANGGTNTSSIKGEIISTVQDGKRTDTEIQEYIYANFELNGFTEDAYIKNFNFTCANCSTSGVTFDGMEYYNAANEWVSLTPDVDLSKVLEPNAEGIRSGTVRIRIHITKAVLEDEENCVPANYEITYDYFDPNLEYIGALLKDKNKTDKQRMLIIDKAEGQQNSGSLNGSIGCANAVCDTELSVPICSDEEDEAISEIYAPEDIKKCVLDNVDDAGNTYQLTETNGGVNTDNAYCQVFCKEDYFDVINDGVDGGIKLNPEVEDVNCGGFFQLTAHVEGKKDCYTGGVGTDDKEINREQYLEDIEDVQERLVDAMNRYYMYKAMSEHQKETLTNNVSVSCYCGGSAYGDTINVYWDEYDEVTFTWDENSENGTYSYGTHSGGSDGWSDNCWCNGDCACGTDGEGNTKYCSANPTCDSNASSSYSSWVSQVNQGLSQAIQDLSDFYEEYVKIIQDFNACTVGWDNEYLFSQQLSFFYSEYQGEEEYTPYYDLISTADDDTLYYLDAEEDTLVEESEVEICTGTADKEYNCESGSNVYDGDLDVNADEWNYASSYNSVYTDRRYVVCSVSSGCTYQNRQISDATFVRKTVKKAQDYITPTVFYQIEANGRITVNSGYTGDALKLDALINSLPISTSATGGGVFRLMLEDLGEFYDTGEVGRLIDFEGDYEEDSVAVAVGREGIETFDGNYTCYYYSDCRPDDCPNCDFVCEEGECHWEDCPECVFDCVNCVFNLDELQIHFKPISTVNVNSADRELGYNWNVNTTLAALELLRDKAELTIQEIETENETIYDKTGEDSALDFSIRMNADIINYLKDYNDEVEDYGGYANDSLTCYSATIDGKEYKNIFCYSEVIDYLVDNYDEQITVNNRTPEGSRSDSDNSANSNNYWTLWDWTEPARDDNGQYTVIGGPSWK